MSTHLILGGSKSGKAPALLATFASIFSERLLWN